MGVCEEVIDTHRWPTQRKLPSTMTKDGERLGKMFRERDKQAKLEILRLNRLSTNRPEMIFSEEPSETIWKKPQEWVWRQVRVHYKPETGDVEKYVAMVVDVMVTINAVCLQFPKTNNIKIIDLRACEKVEIYEPDVVPDAMTLEE